MSRFAEIRARAEQRKGGARMLASLLPKLSSPARLKKLGDDRALAEMTRRVFCAGFAWRVVDAKWPGFEEAFLGFTPERLLAQPDDYWDALSADTRVVRHGAKIAAARANAQFVADIAAQHGSFGRMLAAWPSARQDELLELLARRGSRLGGNTGQMLLRFLGWDGYVLSHDVVVCLRGAGLDIADPPRSKGDLRRVQAQFNAWAQETGLPYTQLSRICAYSTGENYPVQEIAAWMD